MDAGRLVGGLALLGGTAALGGVASYAAVRSAGDSDGSGSAPLVGMLGGNAMIAGGIAGIVTMQATRIGDGAWAPGVAKLLTIPAGIAGAILGGRIARAGLEDRHGAEYDAAGKQIDAAMSATTDALAAAGADRDVLSRVRESYDRSFFNAAYKPPLGPFRNEIVIGRAPGTGASLAIDDVIAHEFSHKVIHAYAPQLLGSKGDGRAIHESVADTFAMVVDDEDWLVGEDAVPGGMRSFSHPEERGSFSGGVAHPAPITREQLADSTEEHLGAGVGNKAAWRIGDALGRGEMARIYVAALERRDLGEDATYEDLARSVRAASVDLYGAGSREATVVSDAWTRAGY
jgi:hypothetical protein